MTHRVRIQIYYNEQIFHITYRHLIHCQVRVKHVNIHVFTPVLVGFPKMAVRLHKL